MRIGIDLIPIIGGGAGLQRYAQQLIEGLAKFGHENEYVLFLNEKVYNSFSIKQDNFKNIKVRTPPRTRFVFGQIYLPFRSIFENLDLLHSPVSASPYFTSKKSVVTVLDLTFLLYPETMTKRSRFYWDFFMRLSIKKAWRIITMSESTKGDLINYFGVPDKKIRVIHISLIEDLSRSKLAKSHIERVKKKYGLPERYILYLGTLEPRKNIKRLVQAFYKVKKKGDIEYKLIIAGKKGWLFSDIFQVVNDLDLRDDVIFTGFIPDKDLPGIYSGAALFVFPSLYEGFGLPPLEAMACGTPVITSNVSSLPEVVGNAAILIDPYNIEELADAIYRVLSDANLRSEMINKGLSQVKKFSWERCARETLRVYEEVYSQ